MHIQNLQDGSILITAPVMIPGRPDCDFMRGEPPLTRNQVLNFAKSYEKYKFVDSEHEITKTGKKRGHKRDSYILEADKSFELFDGSTEVYPAGTWMMTSHVTDPEAIRKANNGEYTGYSPAVRSRETADKYLEALKSGEDPEADKSFSSAGLIKDIPDPVVLSVSLVKKPCQTGSKICKLKNGEKMSDELTFKSKILEAMGMSDAADVESLKSQVVSIDEKLEELRKDNEEALKSMKEEIVSDFKAALSKAFADKAQEDEEEEEEEEETPQNDETSNDEEETNSSEEDEEEDDEDLEADKGSKQGKNHNGSDKSQEIVDTYTFLGRNPDGTRKRN